MKTTIVRSQGEYFSAVKTEYCIGVYVADATDYDSDRNKCITKYAIYIYLTNGKVFYGGIYATKEKAEIVAKECMAYISGRSPLEGDFQFPDDEDIKEEDK